MMLDSAWREDVYMVWTVGRLDLDSEGEMAQRVVQECLELTHDFGR